MTEGSRLRILLLGAPTVTVDDEPLQIQRRMLRWMLYYLACQKEMVGRSDLILLFWPDEPEEDARRHLREILSKLRAQLPQVEMIITEQDRVGLDARQVYTDVLEFQALYAQTARICAQTPSATPLTQAVHQQVVRAVRLWRSPRLLAGASLPESENLNDWLLSLSQQLENQRQRLLERLVDHDIASGDVESAIHWLQSALEGDETSESLHYQLLNLLYKQDRYSEALNYCTYLQELFRREGYDDLPPSLLSLSRQIREEASRPEPGSSSGRPAWPSLADMQVPFVGQKDLLQEMQFAVRRGSPVIIFGEAGAGKSRLVRELFFSLKPAPRLLLAPARMMETGMPYQPIIDMLRHDVQAEEWKQIDLAWVTPLAYLLPELSIMRPGVNPPQAAPDQQRSLIFEALRQVLKFLGKKQRFLLFLDNAQWSDEDTLAALAYLAERGLLEENGALILAARPEEVSAQLERFLNQPRSAYSVLRVSVPPLGADEIGTLAHYVLGDSFDAAIVPRLERETGGNPLFLLETLRLVQDYVLSPLQPRSIARLPLASTIHAVIRERLQHLTPNDAQVLSIAAVIGNEFSVDILESTSMLPAEQVAHTLESLAQVNLIQAVLQDHPSSGYSFVHDKVREVILLDLSPARRRLFHLRIARTLDQKQQGQSFAMEATLAGHYEEAGELNAAFQHWLRTAAYAWRVSAKEQAIDALNQAEQILQRLGDEASDISVYQLYRQWGRLAYDLSDPDMMQVVFQRLLDSGRSRQNPLLAGSAYNGFAQMAELRMQSEEGMAYLDKAMPFLEQTGRLFEHIEARNHRGAFLIQTGRYRDAQGVFAKAQAIGERVVDAQGIEARSLTEYWQSVLFNIMGMPVQALEMARRSYQDAEEAFFPFGMVRALGMQSVIQTYMGDNRPSLETAERAILRAQSMRLEMQIGEMRGSAAQACLALGDLDGCLAYAQQARESARKYPYSMLEDWMNCALGQMYFFLEDYAAARQEFYAGSQRSSDNFLALENRIHLAMTQSAQGEGQEALEVIEDCIIRALSGGLMLYHLQAQVAKAGILIRAGQQVEAQEILDFAESEARQRSLQSQEIRVDLLRAKIALAERSARQAVAMACQAAAKARQTEHILLEIEAYRLWQQAIFSTGDETILPDCHDQGDFPAKRFAECLAILQQHSTRPEISTLVAKLLPNVDRIS